MEIITQELELDKLKSRDLVTLKCLLCKENFKRIKKMYLDCKKEGGLSGSFCSSKCAGAFKARELNVNCQCENCHKNIIKHRNQFLKQKHHFCSSSCCAIFFNNIIRHRPKRNCLNCNNEFFISGHHNKKYCSRKCLKEHKNFGTTIEIELKCTNCQNLFKRKSSTVHKESLRHFCNRSCQAIYANKTYNRAGRFGINKSKAESQLVEIIKRDFPDLLIIENDRKTIPGGLEIDVYIPSKFIAVELNGPCHYIPIFGSEALEKTQNHDIIKMKFLQENKINFIIINIMGARKRLTEILNESYIKNIKPFLI